MEPKRNTTRNDRKRAQPTHNEIENPVTLAYEEYETQIDEFRHEQIKLRAENDELKQQLEDCRSGLVSHDHLTSVISKL